MQYPGATISHGVVASLSHAWYLPFGSCFQIVLANPGSEIMKKLDSSKVLEAIGHEWIFPTVAEAVVECDYSRHSQKPGVLIDIV
ncbi:hypothetical protein GUJ93_ZPchr0006g45467 [Zizania palustris]|uniref:STAS domain-containing protein n=1 Tax=Zizania palustris TaxID=103762 RepID=A0A8J5VND6_ZIZPA|nr:hypothetical protein GUJ93_ZPchr0006g45467 [Zizania palustris]